MIVIHVVHNKWIHTYTMNKNHLISQHWHLIIFIFHYLHIQKCHCINVNDLNVSYNRKLWQNSAWNKSWETKYKACCLRREREKDRLLYICFPACQTLVGKSISRGLTVSTKMMQWTVSTVKCDNYEQSQCHDFLILTPEPCLLLF